MTPKQSIFPTIEHIAWQVEDPDAVAAWYGEHFGFTIRRHFNNAARAQFLADTSGNVIFEIYNNPKAPVPDYRNQDPLTLHIAFKVDSVQAARDALLAAGGEIVDDCNTTAAGDDLVMMRDPWGFPVQFVKRAEPM